MAQLPVLWSFRRCPYAIRARLAILSSGLCVDLRDIQLRDKPDAFLRTSASGTVPTLDPPCGPPIDESLDIMRWALAQNDPERLLEMPEQGWQLIETCDGPFKAALDHTKYASRFPDRDVLEDRLRASEFVAGLEARLTQTRYLLGDNPTLADDAIVPFIRQLAFIDRTWFDAQPWPHVISWLDRFLESARFATVMEKAPVWTPDSAPLAFGGKFASER